jgi:hypothetical protein
MNRFASIVVAALVALGAFGAGGAMAATVYGYSAAGEWFSPGEGYGGAYDHHCGPWISNNFSKSANAWGLITFIDTRGGWNLSMQGVGWLRRELSVAQSRTWSKKPHCKNNSSATYQGGCFGFRESNPSCV